jgi:transposase
MTKRTTLQQEYNDQKQVLYLAFELSAKNWLLGFSIGLGQKPRRRTIAAGKLPLLLAEIVEAKKRFGLAESAPVVSCYEAGRDGFWLDRWLRSSGIDNLVVDSSSIEVNRRSRRAKTDKIDLASLLKLLIRHHLGEPKVWSPVHVPSAEEEDRRQTHRELQALREDRKRIVNRVKGLLASQGGSLQPGQRLTEKWVETIRLCNGAHLGPGLQRRLKRELQRLQWVKTQIAEIELERRNEMRQKQQPDLAKIEQLQTLRGIGMESSWILVREFFGWREFDNGKQVGSLAGCCPTPYDSGGSKVEQGISKAGNKRVRAVCVQVAWSWLRLQPNSQLTQWFMARYANGGKRARKIGIVAVARRLLVQLWRYLKAGVLPEGAELKKTAATA